MLKSLSMTNFQSHKDSRLEFSKGVNVIVGPSDSGKTAVLRALGWVVNNRPSGEVFRHHGSNRTKVMIETDNCEVTRMRSDKENLYRLSGNRLEAFGQDVPGVVKDALGFGILNIQSQMDAPFLLSSSSGEVAQTLNRCVNLDVIDTSLSNIASHCRRVGDEIKVEEVRSKELEEKLKAFEGLDIVEGLIETAEKQENQLQDMTEDSTSIVHLLEEADELNRVNMKINTFLMADKIVELVDVRMDEWNRIERESLLLVQQIREVEYFNRDLVDIESLLMGESILTEAIESAGTLTRIEGDRTGLIGLVKQYESLGQAIEHYTHSIIEEEQVYHKKMPKVCPLCGRGECDGKI